MLPMYLRIFLALALQDNKVEDSSGRAWDVGPLHSCFSQERADHPLGLSSVDVGAVEASTHRCEPTGASDEPVQRCLMEVPAEPSKDTHNGAKGDPEVLQGHIWWWRGLFKPSTILGCDSVKCF